MIKFSTIKNIIDKQCRAFVFIDTIGKNSGFLEFGKEGDKFYVKIGNFDTVIWGEIIDHARTLPWRPLGGARFMCDEQIMNSLIPMFMDEVRKITKQKNYSRFSITDDGRY